MANPIKKAYKEKSILIRHGTPENFTITLVNFVGYATVREHTLIVVSFLPLNPHKCDSEICRFRDTFLAREACDIVNQAIKEGWEAVDLMIMENGRMLPDARKTAKALRVDPKSVPFSASTRLGS